MTRKLTLTEINEALLGCAIDGNPDNVEEMLAQGARIDMRDAAGKTALHFAAAYGHLAVMRVLLDNGADIDDQTYDAKLTPLHMAAHHRKAAAAKLLVEKGADVSLRDNEKRTAEDIFPEIARFIFRKSPAPKAPPAPTAVDIVLEHQKKMRRIAPKAGPRL